MIQSRKARQIRARVVAYLNYLYVHRASLPYEEARPMRSFPTPYLHVPAHPTDCSESSAIVLQASGAPTPYVARREGYTGTMLAKLKHISKRMTRRGDFAVFVNSRFPEGEHVVVLLQGGMWHRDPLVFSHGRPGVDRMTLRQMAAGFPGSSIVYLRAVPTRL